MITGVDAAFYNKWVSNHPELIKQSAPGSDAGPATASTDTVVSISSEAWQQMLKEAPVVYQAEWVPANQILDHVKQDYQSLGYEVTDQWLQKFWAWSSNAETAIGPMPELPRRLYDAWA